MILALTGVPLVIVSVIAFIIILGVIIVVHEGGHFFFARRAGILCHEFSIGMGPAVYKKRVGETNFCIRAIPIGGFVSMAGEEVESEQVKVGNFVGLNFIDGKVSEIILDENMDASVKGEIVDVDLYGIDGKELFITINDGIGNHYYTVLNDAFYVFNSKSRIQITPYNRSFESKSLLQRFLTLVAGTGMNFVLAIVIYLIVSFATGVPNYESTKIGSLSTAYPVSEVLEVGDEITKINGVSIDSWNDLSVELGKLIENNQNLVEVEFIRDGVTKTGTVKCMTYIVSLGISDIQVKDEKFPQGVTEGVRLGNVAVRYLDEAKKGKYPIAYGDIITKMRVDTVTKDGTIEGEVVSVTSWNQLISVFKDVDVANVYFEYYSYAKEGIVSIEECAALQTYGNEVLVNQRIDKLQIKMGISPENHFDFFGVIGNAFTMFWNDFTLIFRTLGLLIAPSGIRQVGVSDLSSFVGIFGLVEQYVGAGLISLLAFAAMLSVNIGVMNLLPIPALDGGRVVFLGYELVTRKKPSKKVENIINNVFFILLMILFVFVTYNDILRLFR